MDFVEALTHELRGRPSGGPEGQGEELSSEAVRDMLARAAAVVIVELSSDLRLYRQIDPATLTVFARLELGSPEDSLLLLPGDVATLRALLMSFDENTPARVGEMLTVPARLADGRIVWHVVAEMLPGEDGRAEG